jgi:DNA invertase Pin-like site-specific DNA recombinase
MAHKQDTTQATRFAIYTRFSSDLQNEISLESQELMCRKEIAARGGVVTSVYRDEAKFGWTLDRDGIAKLRSDAAKKKFDAVIVWKFDRLGRDHTQVTAIKALFRHEYGTRLYCVEGFSEDDGDGSSPYQSMMEQMLSVISDFYSRNLGSEVSRANINRHENGKFNGSRPPLGYLLAVEKKTTQPRTFPTTDEYPPGLYVDARAAAIIRRAFKLYASGKHSYTTVADYINHMGALMRPPLEWQVTAYAVREILQNRVYLGEVSYSKTQYKGGFQRRRASDRYTKSWRQGNHSAIITEDLFNQCQGMRERNAKHKKNPDTAEIHLLSGLIYSQKCLDSGHDHTNPILGKMHGVSRAKESGKKYAYRCDCVKQGYSPCGQSEVKAETIEAQVLSRLFNAADRLPKDSREAVTRFLRERVETAAAMKRIDEIQSIIKRIDFSWENGFLSQPEYLEKRMLLQSELEAISPVDEQEIIEDIDMLRGFKTMWEAARCREEQRELFKQMVARVVINGSEVKEVWIHGVTPLLLQNDTSMRPEGLETIELPVLRSIPRLRAA